MAKRSKPDRRGRKNTKKIDGVPGIVTDALPDTLFCVRLDNGMELKAYLAGKMRLYRIRVLVGDRVMVELEPYGGKARIVKRL
jgi:translation initiation factor IF-1